jgi:hypothetical protein
MERHCSAAKPAGSTWAAAGAPYADARAMTTGTHTRGNHPMR